MTGFLILACVLAAASIASAQDVGRIRCCGTYPEVCTATIGPYSVSGDIAYLYGRRNRDINEVSIRFGATLAVWEDICSFDDYLNKRVRVTRNANLDFGQAR